MICTKLIAALCIHGIASWYGPGFDGKKAADGSTFQEREFTAASRTIPLGTVVDIVNLRNGRVARVLITDRGPYIGERILDLSRAAARYLGFENDGLALVEIAIVRIP